MVKSAEHRDKITARVREAFAKHPTFETIPVFRGKAYLFGATVSPPDSQQAYVAALHALFAHNPDKAQIAGRVGNKIIGK